MKGLAFEFIPVRFYVGIRGGTTGKNRNIPSRRSCVLWRPSSIPYSLSSVLNSLPPVLYSLSFVLCSLSIYLLTSLYSVLNSQSPVLYPLSCVLCLLPTILLPLAVQHTAATSLNVAQYKLVTFFSELIALSINHFPVHASLVTKTLCAA